MSEQLTDRERRILDLEARMPRHGGAKEEAIRGELSLTPARYYLLLDRLLDAEAALAYDPLLVRRLRRVRDEGARRRAQRVSGAAG